MGPIKYGNSIFFDRTLKFRNLFLKCEWQYFREFWNVTVTNISSSSGQRIIKEWRHLLQYLRSSSTSANCCYRNTILHSYNTFTRFMVKYFWNSFIRTINNPWSENSHYEQPRMFYKYHSFRLFSAFQYRITVHFFHVRLSIFLIFHLTSLMGIILNIFQTKERKETFWARVTIKKSKTRERCLGVCFHCNFWQGCATSSPNLSLISEKKIPFLDPGCKYP